MYIETQIKKLVHIFPLLLLILGNFHSQDEVWSKWKMIMLLVVWWKKIHTNYDNIKISHYNFRCLICFEVASMFNFKTPCKNSPLSPYYHFGNWRTTKLSCRCLAVELSPWNFTLHKIEGVRCCHLSNAWDGTRLSLELHLKTRLKGRDVATIIIFSSSTLQRNHNKAWNAHITCIFSQFCVPP